METGYAMLALCFVGLTGVSIVGDRLQTRRRKQRPGQVGLIPWPLMIVLSLLSAAVFLAFWLKEG